MMKVEGKRLKETLRHRMPRVFSLLKRANGIRLKALSPANRVKMNAQKRSKAKRARAGHVQFIEECRTKKRLKVLFIGLHRSIWKTDDVFRAMQLDAAFDPAIILVPTLDRDESWADSEQRAAHSFFEKRGYRVHCASRADGAEAAIRQVEELAPDLVFFTNHHVLTFPELYRHLLGNYLTCYVPYGASVSRFNDYQPQYNRPFHNEVWKIFAPHSVAARNYRSVQAISGRNVTVTGYPAFEPLVSKEMNGPDPWKPMGLKRIIWAPHHTIDMPSLPYANFLRYAEYFTELVDEYADRVQWCFKPHPLLKPKLFKHPDWGPERTEAYYEFWENHSNTQLELGEYTSLFRNSDAMIHDSGSFLAEYLYVDKPVMFLWSSPQVVKYFNDYGLEALAACDRGDIEADMRRFIETVLRGDDPCRADRHEFLERHPISINEELPSDRIMKEIRASIWP